MDLNELKKRAGKFSIPMAVVEKDYALTIILQSIAASGLEQSVVFKGGTAIKKIYFSEARFSEDLDFTIISGMPKEVEENVRRTFENKKIDNLEIITVEHEKTTAGLRMSLKFLGPLEYPQRIRLDFSFREKPSARTKKELIVDDYGKISIAIKTLSLEEILAEKLRAISSREAPRDLYDLWFLLNKGVKVDKQLVAKKFEIYNETFKVLKVREQSNKFKKNWKTNLQQFMNQVPLFETVEKEVMEKLEKEFSQENQEERAG
jgi:predicted nucleotidyltransferase component of viral defense system